MTRWTGIVLALSRSAGAEMASRLVTYLHPVAGRPLVWHAVSSLAALPRPPERIVVLTGMDLTAGLFQDLSVPVEVLAPREGDPASTGDALALQESEGTIVIDAAAVLAQQDLELLLDAPPGSWLPADRGAAAARLDPQQLAQLLRLPEPLVPPNGVLAQQNRIETPSGSISLLVRDRAGLARAAQRVRDRVVRALMDAGVTFLLPESVVVDVDVRVGRDSIVYPGVVLEGQTTIGEETVIGPGCRIIDSWVGSGVELRGWNYISHTSVRNRAILEPYVRRGFD